MNHPDFDPNYYEELIAEPILELELPAATDTMRLGRALAGELGPGDFLGLIGDLGAGKTTLVKALVEGLSSEHEAKSPTYTLLNEYDTEPPVVHVDLYRLQSADELESIGYWDYAESSRAITCVEWLDRIPGAWPRRGLILEMQRVETRRLARLWASEEYGDLGELAAKHGWGTPGG